MASPASRRRAAARCTGAIALLLAAMIVGGCEHAPTPNPAIEAAVEPVGNVPVSGVASIADVGQRRLSFHVGIEAIDPPPSAADVRRGGCESADVILHLEPLDPLDRFEWDGELFGSLATVRPVAVVVLDINGRPMGCAVFDSNP